MSDIPGVVKLLELAEAFNEAATRHVEAYPETQMKIQQAVTPDDEQKMMETFSEFMALTINAASDENMTDEKFTEISAPIKIRAIDTIAGILNRVMAEDTVSGFVQGENRSEEASIGFEMQGASTLAQLHAPKP